MNKLMQIAMLSCKKASALTEKKTVSTLNFIEKKQLNWHLKMCVMCSKYKKQSVFIDCALDKLQNGNNQQQIKLSEEKKRTIIHSLNHT